eukprot:TRINITY_DN7529_c0_g1_i1.p1 TRINITY_DN7529_c0_g1~~TRINITY_DN7529_c0_g1_i1.p1  ORF type:complete len:400 (-),score=93.08 TRINITY_DN7529_c0_g1_i1:39-1238(-)
MDQDKDKKEPLILFDDAEDKVIQLKLDATKEVRIEQVTVFNDRAEIFRRLSLKIADAGVYNITVEGLPTIVDRNSIHISGGQGAAVILEVSSDLKYHEKKKAETSSAAELDQRRADLKKLNDTIRLEQAKLSRVEKNLDWLEGWAGNVQKLPTQNLPKQPHEQKTGATTSTPLPDFISGDYLSKTAKFAEFYETQLEKFEEKKYELLEKLEELNREQKIKSEELQAMTPDASTAESQKVQTLDVSILVKVLRPGELSLDLVYIIAQAKWSPSYDIRVASNGTSQLTYYGVITNSTGEDWSRVKLSLSTAQPSIGGSPPEIKTCRVRFDHGYGSYSNYNYAGGLAQPEFASNALFAQQTMATPFHDDPFSGGGGGGGDVGDKPPGMAVLTTTLDLSLIHI